MLKTIAGGVELGCDVRGSGPALVLLHAFPLDRRMWDDVATALAGSRRVITVDTRGFGESACGDAQDLGGAYTIDALADDVAQLLDALGVPIAAVCGLSMGGYIALALAERHPARLGRLVLADTRAAADTPDAKRARDDGIARVRSDGAAAFVAPMPARLLSPAAPAPVVEHARALMAAQPGGAICAALAAMRDRADRTALLATLRCETLVVVGADDAITPPAEARGMADAIPGARYVELARAGHLANLEAPAAFTRALADFLDETD
jgi:3-oxoadipate enol-lactonase